jgi:hypothetical protein
MRILAGDQIGIRPRHALVCDQREQLVADFAVVESQHGLPQQPFATIHSAEQWGI